MMDTEKNKRKKTHDFASVFAKRLSDLLDGNKTGKKVTQQELADYIDVKRQTVSEYRNGTSIPNADKLKGIAEFFGVSADYLLNLTDDNTSDLDLRAIYEDVGLSSVSLEKIKALNPLELRFFNYVMERNFLDEFMKVIRSVLIEHANFQVQSTLDIDYRQQYKSFFVSQFMLEKFNEHYDSFLRDYPFLIKTIRETKLDSTDNSENEENWASIWSAMKQPPYDVEDLL